ncbi:hypothetical protein Tco_1143285 [Tanacetum coccineum]
MQFRDILQIYPKVGNKKFEEPPLKKEILAFLASLGYSGEIRKITDVNVNKLHQPWRSFDAIINKCLSLIVNFVMAKDPSIPRRNKVNWHYARDDPMFTTINVISRNEDTQLYGVYLPPRKIPPKTKASKKKADSDAPTKQKSPTFPKEKKGKKTGKGKQKAKELETISEAPLTEAEQLKISPEKRVPDAPDYDSDDDISWKSSEDDQDKDKDEDDENVQDDDDDVKSRDDELKSQDDQDNDDEAQTESEDDGDDFNNPKLTTHDDETTHEEETDEDDTFDPIVHTPSHVLSSDDEDSDNEVEGVDVEGEKSDEDATYVEDKEMRRIEIPMLNLKGRDYALLYHLASSPTMPKFQIKIPCLMLYLDIMPEATSLNRYYLSLAIGGTIFFHQHSTPKPTPLFIQLQQPLIRPPATTQVLTSHTLPDFGSLTLSSIPGIADQYLANKMQEAVDVAVQLKSDRIREEAQAESQQFLESIDEGIKNIIKEQVNNEVSKITPKIEKLVNEQLESGVYWNTIFQMGEKKKKERGIPYVSILSC